jgi:hypothetical protein
MRDKLLGPQIGKWGQLQEWQQDVDDPKDQHRHVSHLFAVHPGRQINPVTTPELSKAASVSLNARGDAGTGWSKAWKDGSVTGLRARGGFDVDLAWRGGKLSHAVISTSKGGKAYVRTNGKIQAIDLPASGKHEINP